jgi:hypothetical protein
MKVHLRFSNLRACAAVFATAFLAACSSSTGDSSPTTTQEPSRTPDAASLVRTYVAMLSRDLAPLQPLDAACRGAAEACRAALDQAAVIAAKVGDDLQHTPAEPNAIQKPVEDIRASATLVLSIARAFDAGTMSASEAVNAYTAEYNTLSRRSSSSRVLSDLLRLQPSAVPLPRPSGRQDPEPLRLPAQRSAQCRGPIRQGRLQHGAAWVQGSDGVLPCRHQHIHLGQRAVEPLTLRFGADYLTRDPVPLVHDAGFRVDDVQRSRAGIVFWVAVRKIP